MRISNEMLILVVMDVAFDVCDKLSCLKQR